MASKKLFTPIPLSDACARNIDGITAQFWDSFSLPTLRPYDLADMFTVLWQKLKASGANDETLLRERFRKSSKEFLLQGSLTRHSVAKPFGYSGDFQLIDHIYTKYTSSEVKDKQHDDVWQAQMAAAAVRNRKELFKSYFNTMAERHNGCFSLLNLGSGPGRDLHEAIEQCSGSLHGFYCACVDADLKALEYAASILTPYHQQISFHHGNLLTFKPTDQFDFVWCAGVFDYFNDEVAGRILKRLYRWTKTGGLCAIGNFTPSNPTRAFMELALDWHLQYRTELDYRKICARAGISSARISFDYDQTNVVLICKVT